MEQSLLTIRQEVIGLLSSFRDIMRKNYEKLDVEKIQERWFVVLIFPIIFL